MSRILTSARYEDVWKYLKLKEIVAMFPRLKMRKEIKEMWKRALTAWGFDFTPKEEPAPPSIQRKKLSHKTNI